MLSDGNRIARKTPTRIYRDSEGRTRREQLSAAGEVQSVSISDPVAGSMYVLNPAAKTAIATACSWRRQLGLLPPASRRAAAGR